MKQIILTILSILISCPGFTQQINITISDSLSKENLPFASVYLKNTGIGTTSNFKGKAELIVKTKNLDSDTLICSYIGYQTKSIPVDLSKSIHLEIQLSQSATNLSELVITYKKPLSSKQILKKAIKNTAKNYSRIPVNLHGLYRETLKEKDHYTYLNEAVVDIHYTKYPQNKVDRKIWEDWYYDDTYAFEFKGGWFTEFPTHFNTKEDKAKLIEARTSESWSPNNFDRPINGGPLSLTSKDFIKYRYDFLNPDIFSKYTYDKKENQFVNNHSCYVFHFYPKESNRTMVFSYSRKLNRSIYVGKVYIDMETFAVVKMEYQLAQNVDFGFYKHHVPLNDIVTVDYQELESTWYLKKITRTKTRGLITKVNQNKTLYQTNQELIITEIITDSVIQFKEDETWKHTRITTLRNRDVPYNTAFWKTYEKTTYPKLKSEITQDLEVKIPLETQFKSRFQQKENLQAPIAKKVAFAFDYPTEKLADNYHWFADTTQKGAFYKYLSKENEFANNFMIPYKNYQKNYFNSLNNFYPKDTTQVQHIYKKGDIINDEDSLGNNLLYEYQDSINRSPILNITRFQDSRLNSFITSIKHYQKNLGIAYTNNGGLNNSLIILSKGTNTILDSIADVYSYEWFNDSIILYTQTNSIKRSDKLYLRNLNSKKDSLLLFEKDFTYDISISQSKSYLICTIESKEESELFLINKESKSPSLQLIIKRQPSVKYELKEFNNQLYMITNKDAVNNKVLHLTDKNSWEEMVPHSKDVLITDLVVTTNFVVLRTYKNSYLELIYKKKSESKWHHIDFKTNIFSANFKYLDNDKIKIYFSNPNTPFIQYQFDLTNSTLTKTKTTKIKRGIYLRYFKTERLWAKSKDGKKVPITITKSVSPIKEHKGLILKAYGAYGNYPMGNGFSAEDLILMNDGFTIAYAHIRGSNTLGKQWYFDGKLLNKENSFNDYIACAEYLIEKKYTTSSQLIGYGNSAGGLIMGTVINRRPELFNTVILDHPYLDVLSTMMNDSLPLTTDEYKEFGDPSNIAVYEYMKNYSPYQNITKQEYPNLLFIASSNDYQTPVWQVASYVAKLREYNTGNNSILFRTDFGSGHIGNTSGKEWIKALSFQYGYIYGNIFK
jgi:protease II